MTDEHRFLFLSSEILKSELRNETVRLEGT